MQKVWEDAIQNNSFDALNQLDCRATNRKPTAVKIRWSLGPPRTQDVFHQPSKTTCGLGAVRNAGVLHSDVPPNASAEEVAVAVQGDVLASNFTDSKCRRGNVPHLIYAYDSYNACSEGYLLPYCQTHEGRPHCQTSLVTLQKWIQEYDTLILLYYHAVGNEDGHYVVLKRPSTTAATSTNWQLLCSVCGSYSLPSTVAVLLLLRGAAAIVGVKTSRK